MRKHPLQHILGTSHPWEISPGWPTLVADLGRQRHAGAMRPLRAKGDDEPDWNAEMSIFQKRISRPNQLATLRELEGKVAVGKVG